MDEVASGGWTVAVTIIADAVDAGDGTSDGVLEGVSGGANVGKLGKGVGVTFGPQADIRIINKKIDG